jgi:hypothetical protein
MIELIDDDDRFIPQFFPDFIGLLEQINEMQSELQKKGELHKKFQRWREQGEAIEAEFQIITG